MSHLERLCRVTKETACFLAPLLLSYLLCWVAALSYKIWTELCCILCTLNWCFESVIWCCDQENPLLWQKWQWTASYWSSLNRTLKKITFFLSHLLQVIVLSLCSTRICRTRLLLPIPECYMYVPDTSAVHKLVCVYKTEHFYPSIVKICKIMVVLELHRTL